MPVIKAVAYNFVTERCPGEVMALGINSIREVCRRIPALLEEEGMDVLVVVSRRAREESLCCCGGGIRSGFCVRDSGSARGGSLLGGG